MRGVRRPGLVRLAPGVACAAGGEVVLDRSARPAADPALLLRACAEAAERELPLAPATAARLAREGAPLGSGGPTRRAGCWCACSPPDRAAAAGLGDVEETGALDAVLPEWERIRLFPHASPVHRFTVDRHVVETCVAAAGLIRTVARPRRPRRRRPAARHRQGRVRRPQRRGRADRPRRGHPDGLRRRRGRPDRHPGAPPPAAGRDGHQPRPDDPVTVAAVADAVRTPDALSLLVALTEADAGRPRRRRGRRGGRGWCAGWPTGCWPPWWPARPGSPRRVSPTRRYRCPTPYVPTPAGRRSP